ncbi:myosin-7-like isoform X2 [Ceratina calcarata]|uniref:Myosin-7-like isoform X2 n=1 Tax=Ceratina calcarata TaxID=156304 RepID=A0AAJ7WCF5_9HYME|nr:myosin-7-like isoform X2 [Ceratina calcarata]
MLHGTERRANMSYVEHGPRIFLATKHNSGTPLMYGDYVLPKKRLEGRLKLHDSCQDIRAWSPNSLEKSRYFRELSENESPIGKIIPFNVVIDNIIQLNSQAQNELQTVKKELQKYKTLELTPQQRQQLKDLNYSPKAKELMNRSNYTTGLIKDAFNNTRTSNSMVRSNSCFSIHIPCERHLYDETRQRPAARNQSNQLYSYSLTAFDVGSCLNNYNLVSPCGPAMKSLPVAECREKRTSCVECIDVEVQVGRETRDAETQVCYQSDIKKRKKRITISVISQTSFTSKSSEDNSAMYLDKSSLQTNNQEEQSSECDASCSDSSQDIGTPSESDIEMGAESDSDLHNNVHKGIIIQKDSEIIVLKNELCVRDAELEELRDMNKHLEMLLKEREDCIHGQQGNLKILHEKLCKADREHDREVEDLKKKQRLQEVDRLAEKAEDYNKAVEELRTVLEERDELRKENYEQNCLLKNQEEKLNQLVKVVKEMSVAYNEQMEEKNMYEQLKLEARDKDAKICEYEEQLVSMKQEISDFFNNLKTALNNLEEMNDVCEDICSCTTCDLDIGEEANNILYNINIIMTRLQTYKTESQYLLQQIGDLKYYVGTDKETDRNRNLKSIICEDFYFDSETEYNKYICKLSRNDMDEVEREVIQYFARFLIKLRSLISKLQIYVEFERPLMIKQTYYFYEILKDTQSAVNVSEDVTLRRQLLSDLYNQHKEEHERYNSYVKQLPNDLLQVQDKINEFIEDILYQLLNEMLHAEKEHLYDEKINQAFETHFRSCINRIDAALQGAGDQRIMIVETIEEQQKELKKKDVEIARLKEEMAERLERRGEGDCLQADTVDVTAIIKEHLSRLTAELDEKDALVSELEDQLEIFRNRLSARNKDCSVLKKENKNLENAKNRLSRRAKECQQVKRQLTAKNQQIKNLTQQIQELLETKDLTATLEHKITEMEKELTDLQLENVRLGKTVKQTSIAISTKDKIITSLKTSIDKTDSILSEKIIEYENVVEEKRRHIVTLEEENKLLNEKVKNVEKQLVLMNQTIVSLTEQKDKIHVIYTLQEDLAKLDKDERRLKVELNNLKAQLVNDQNKNRKLDNSLETCQRENELLKKNIEYWKSENSELSTMLRNEAAEEKLKNKLYTISNNICEKLINLKKQSVLQKDSPGSKFIKRLQAKYITSREKEIELATDNVVKDLKEESRDPERDIKENEVEEIETQLLHSKGDTLKSNYASFKQFRQAETEHSENKNEIEKLLSHIENRDCEIKHHKEIIKHLTQENAKLRTVLKSQIEEYQDKLTLMKKNYDSSLNALCERHKANIEILQKQFEDNMKSEQIFESENWLLSLNLKELMELHERISIIISRDSNVIHMQNENQCLYDNAGRQQFYSPVQETEAKFQFIPTNIYEKEPLQSKIVPQVLKEENLHLQNQWITLGDTQKYPTLQTQSYKPSLEHNFGYFNSEGKSSESENKYEKEKHMEKDSSFDRHWWNFINQCSAYHKLSNVDEYTRPFPTD